jgi:ribosomal protein S18 acetylase RimI-like enzyme
VNVSKPVLIERRLRIQDAEALAAFYNGLSHGSRTTFRPLGWDTRATVCKEIARANQLDEKYDLVACHGSQIVGWCFLWDLHGAEPMLGLGVADGYQGRGIGSRLLSRIMQVARQREFAHVFLTVVQTNQIAQRLYERHGFVRYGEFVDEHDGLAYYRMAATLQESTSGFCQYGCTCC